jgi:hypothetical protein
VPARMRIPVRRVALSGGRCAKCAPTDTATVHCPSDSQAGEAMMQVTEATAAESVTETMVAEGQHIMSVVAKGTVPRQHDVAFVWPPRT